MGKSKMLASLGCDEEDVLWSDELDCKAARMFEIYSDAGMLVVSGIKAAAATR